MDESVKAALRRWPQVPDVYGWLSLSERGQWRLHENGAGWVAGQNQPAVNAVQGEPIESLQIRSFIDRNYAHDERGRWYFQNGPQRVYVRIDAAPYVLHFDDVSHQFTTHNNLTARQIQSWWIDDEGRLYACTEHGPGLVSGRDTLAVFQALQTSTGEPLLSVLERRAPPIQPADDTAPKTPAQIPAAYRVWLPACKAAVPNVAPAPLHFCPTGQLADQLGFARCPAP